MRITVDRDRCIGAGQCALTEPSVFDQSDEDGLVVVRTEHPPANTERSVRYVVALCPSRALGLDED